VELLAGDVIGRFYTFLWPMLRVSALFLTAPVFALAAFNRRLRILVALVFTWLVWPLHDWPVIDPVSAEGIREVFNQVAIGALAGLALQVVVAAMVVAGQAAATSMGLSMASLLDPNLGNVPVISQFLIVLGSLVFVGSGGHAILLGLVAESFHTLPIGASVLTPENLTRLVRWTSMVFMGGVLIALPVMVALLFVNVGVGVVTRAAPSLNIFSVGLPASIVGGFFILVVFLGSMVGRIEWLWIQGFDVVRDLLGVPHVR
jgi:flagellar biosynthetic protein FliR